MKASVQLLIASLAAGLIVPAMSLAAAPTVIGPAIVLSATGQTGAPPDARRQADDFMRQARAAMKEGKLDQADQLIGQAEKLNLTYNGLTDRFKDSPEKLRQLLADERAKGNSPQRPSARFPALLSREPDKQPKPIPNDPFAAQKRTEVVDRLTDDSRAKSTGFLQEARAALQRGDKLAAMSSYQKAIALNVQYGPNEDSPQKLAADLQAIGVNVSELAGASTPTSPFTLKPSDINPGTDNLPLLTGGLPAAMQPGQSTPYTQGAGANPLDAAQRTFAQPADNVALPPGFVAPQRLPEMMEANPAAPRGPVHPAKAEAQRMVAEARMAIDKGDMAGAQRWAEQAQSLNVPEQAYGPEETRPWQVLLEINNAAVRRQGVAPAGGAMTEPQYPVAQSGYNPGYDPSRVQQASAQELLVPQQAAPIGPAQQLYEEGLRALEGQDRNTAMQKFAEAWKYEAQLDPGTRQQLKDKLTFLRGATAPIQPLPAGNATPLDQVGADQERLRQKLIREIANEQKQAEQIAAKDPRKALANLKAVRERVAGAEIGAAGQKQLLTLVDRSVVELEKYIEQNRATIEADEHNNQVKAGVANDAELTVETQNKLAELVEQFNKLMDEQRFPEAEVVAKQANAIAPDYPVVQTMIWKSQFVRNIKADESIKDRSADGFVRSMQSIGESAIPFDDRTPLVFGDTKSWDALSKSRQRLLKDKTALSPAEQEIQRSLLKPVEVRFESRPLQEVLDTLGRMSGINIYLDPQGMHAEGVSTDTPVSINLTQAISMRSALNLILEPIGLSYVIQNEVLRITSEQNRDSNTYAKVYYVADLVIPIPNFVPSYNLGLPGALKESLNSLGYGGGMRPSMSGPLTVAANDQGGTQQINPVSAAPVMAQAMQGGSGMMNGGSRPAQALGSGPGGLGGGVQADFEPLMELIRTTIAPQSWDEVGGPGSVSGFDTNLSLVVSQTQDVHEKIADLLEQLRRLQDLQVTIEVRFITLSDNFFERIGVDFDFAVDDNTGLNNQIDLLPGTPDIAGNRAGTTNILSPYDDRGPSLTFGLGPAGPTADLDFAFNQGGFASTTPTFGSFDATSVGSFGFAILSDIEVFLLLQAGQGDTRTNVLQAPKVTLFNGQQAFVSDTSQRPFVTSVIPVVGDFAAAQQPVIVVLSEGTSLSVQAVVSNDRRYVRLTMVPFFSRIGDVETFTFTGKVTTDTGTTSQDPSDPDSNVVDNQTRTVEGTTVQLPTFAFTTVVTTVSVPDGGTVLLGGIKRLREGRNERGIPLLSKVPYVSRLFKNVGIGRDAQSLMMMVTPRIIIQEEEEEKLGINSTP